MLPGDSAIDNIKTLILGKIVDAAGTRKNGINVPQGFINSAIIAVCATFLTGYFSSLTAYGFALYRFRLKRALWSIIMVVIMVPPTVGLIGFYKLMVVYLNLQNTYWPLILPAIAAPFAVFFLRQYFASALPISLVEAARMDGAKELSVFHRIGLPMSMPGIATISILGFLGTWNNYLGPLIILDKTELFTLPLLIQLLNTSLYNRDFGALYMGISLSVIPILVMFAVFSRYLIDEIGAGSVKE
jgi:multiple sugar transport system permease protein